ncbi:MAG: hypothetical protein IKU59_04715 [Bacteroidales bacterium]|nr:hypothetical protein [Bacteroidales bacterium]
MEKKSNGLGVAGLVLSICALVFCWLPILNWILWFLGVLFSFIGVFKRPKGCAIAGLIISVIPFIIMLVFIGGVAAAL